MDGDNWSWRNNSVGIHWNFTASTNNPCGDHWQGITCALPPPFIYSRIIGLALPDFNLTGTIPDSIANLEYLHELNFMHNHLNGTLPSSMQQLQQLNALTILDNHFSGAIPDFLGSLVSLIVLSIGRNYFTGTIPSSLGQLVHLDTLIMGNNTLSGSLPESLGNLKALHAFDSYRCNLTGSIPNSFGNLTELHVFNAYNNSLTGTLPAGLGNWRNLDSITLGKNKLSGPLPPGMGALRRLKYINFQSNRLTGTVPSEWSGLQSLRIVYLNSNKFHGAVDLFCQLYNITQLYLSVNAFSGTIPECVGNLYNLDQLYLDQNKLVGPIPETLQKPPTMLFLALDSNRLTGTIPASLINLKKLSLLSLFNNLLTGTVPAVFSQFRGLSFLLLQNNYLTGPIVPIFNSSIQSVLTTVQLSNNAFTGPVPEEPFKIPGFTQFSIVDNCMQGSIPSMICGCRTLNILAMDGMGTSASCRRVMLPGLSKSYINANEVDGSIPSCLFQMPLLTTLHLSGNGVIGSLPADLQLGRSLIDLALSHNYLTGMIPEAIQERAFYSLDLSYNRFAGGMSAKFNTKPVRFDLNETVERHIFYKKYVTDESELILENNRLSGQIPETVNALTDIAILNGNLFSCNLAQSDLPKHDSARDDYQCGSGFINVQYYVWVALTSSVLFTGLALWWWNDAIQLRYKKLSAALDLLCKWFNILESLQLKGQLKNFRYVDEVARVFGRVAGGCTVLIVVFLTPVHAAMSHYYGTLTHQYAWAVTSMYQSGYVPFAVEFVLYMLLMCALLYMLKLFTQWYLLQIEDDTYEERITSVRLTGFNLPAQVTNAQIFGAYATYFSINFALVMGVNILFVYIALYANNAWLLFAQLCLSMFKGFWNSYGSNFVMRWSFQTLATDTLGSDFINTLLFASLFNNIAIPCLVISAISPSCFYNIFVPAPRVAYDYTYLECAIFVADRCIVKDPKIATTRFNPPFTYSFQCAAQYVTSYCATFLYLALETAFVLPILEVLRIQYYKRLKTDTPWYRFVKYMMPRIVKPVDPKKDLVRDTVYLCFEANQFLVQLMTFLGLILTFGVVFPPLSAALLVAMISLIATNKLITGRYISAAVEKDAPQYLAVIEKDCESVGFKHLSKLKVAAWMLIVFSCFFYALFFFDTVGDAVGFQGGFWVFLVLPLLPVGLFTMDRLRSRINRRVRARHNRSRSHSSSRERRSSWVAGSNEDDLHGMELAEFGTKENDAEADMVSAECLSEKAITTDDVRLEQELTSGDLSAPDATERPEPVFSVLHKSSPKIRGRGVTWTPDV